MKHLFIISIISLFSINAFSQNIQQIKDVSIGGTYRENNVECVEAKDGSLYCLTTSYGNGGTGLKSDTNYGKYDYWVYKLDENGNKIWDRSFGGDESESISDIAIIDSCLYLFGHTFSGVSGNKTSISFGPSIDFWLVKTDLSGNKIWDKSFGGTDLEYSSSIIALPNNTLLLSGISKSLDSTGNKTAPHYGYADYWLLKIDTAGSPIWQKTYGGNEDEFMFNVVRDSITGDFIIGGASFSPKSHNKLTQRIGGRDFWIIRTDSLGNKKNEITLGGTKYEGRPVVSYSQSDSSIYVVGESASPKSGNKWVDNFGAYDLWLIKLNDTLSIQWQKSIAGPKVETMPAIIEHSENGVIIGGTTYSDGDSENITDGIDYGSSDYFAIKYSSNGNKVWGFRTGGFKDDKVSDIDLLSTGEILLSGVSNSLESWPKTAPSYGRSHDNWLVWLSTPTFINEYSDNSIDFSFYPNPVRSKLMFNLQDNSMFKSWGIISITGKTLKSGSTSSGRNSIMMSDLPKGTYIIKLTGKSSSYTRRIIKH